DCRDPADRPAPSKGPLRARDPGVCGLRPQDPGGVHRPGSASRRCLGAPFPDSSPISADRRGHRELATVKTAAYDPPSVHGARAAPPRPVAPWRLALRRYGSRLYPLLTAAALLGVWELCVVASGIGVYLLPRPSAVLVAMFTKATTLLPAAWVTSQEILLGVCLAIIVGIPLAVAIVSSSTVEKGFYPLVVATQVVPKIAVVPILTVWLGFGMPTKVAMAFLISFFPIVIDTIVGLRSVEPGKIQLAKSMGAT